MTINRTTANEALIRMMVDDYKRCGGGPIWMVEASALKAYRADAVTAAATEFAALVRHHGLTQLVAVIVAPTVRMAASVVALTMRAAGAPLDIGVVRTRPEADAIVAK